jgi:exodeoxyribonuclease V alpha subunit
MLYTAMTRARTATVIVGRRDVIAQAAARADTASRRSRLVDRLQGSSSR